MQPAGRHCSFAPQSHLPAFHLGCEVSGGDSKTSHFQSSMALASQKSFPAVWIFTLQPVFKPNICRATPFGFLQLRKGQVLQQGGPQTTPTTKLVPNTCSQAACSHFAAGSAVHICISQFLFASWCLMSQSFQLYACVLVYLLGVIFCTDILGCIILPT